MSDYYEKFTLLVEDTYDRNDETKVTVVCHSMGCPIISVFFNMVEQSWKDKYIKGLISLNGAYGGAVKAVKTIVSGENLGIFIVKPSDIIIEQKTSVSLSYMLPSRHLWKPHEVIAFTKNKKYTVDDYEEFFRDMNYTTAYEMYKDTYPYAKAGLEAPGVPVFCFYGRGLPTVE
ncbi:phosphatidylcholine-sterol acyltransferase, partial [Nephila pilipes]